MKWLKRLLLGKPLENEKLAHEKYSVFWGLPILSSDAISSVAYATEEILLVLVPAIGLLSYRYLSFTSFSIILLLGILIFSYRQTIQSYPKGGGSYIVASDNLGMYAGVMAGSGLAVGYILTVAVSISSGVFNIASAFPFLLKYQVQLAIGILTLLYIGNLRGIRDSAKLFGIPAYVFIFAMLSMIVCGIMKVKVFGYVPPEVSLSHTGTEPLTLFLLLRAFSSGCTALTGVEAVSDSVPNFQDPAPRNAQKVLILIGLIVFTLFGGITVLANLYHVVPSEDSSILSQINQLIFGHGFMYYFIQFATMIILAMAANTAYADFPTLFSFMARDNFVPRQLSQRGERLSYSNGISILTLIAGFLIILFKANVTRLIPLYAVGVFISFTLSQAGMFVRWLRLKEPGWKYKAAVNGVGALVTLVTAFIIGASKFLQGAWVVIIIIPFLMYIFLKIKGHYLAVAEQLRLDEVDVATNWGDEVYNNHIIVPISSLNKASWRALRYAKTIAKDNKIIAFNVATSPELETRIRERWEQFQVDIPLVVVYSTYRKVVEPLIEFIQSYELHNYKKGDMITVVLPQFSVKTWWHIILHNQSRMFIEKELLSHKHIVVATMPLQLKKDREVLTTKAKNKQLR